MLSTARYREKDCEEYDDTDICAMKGPTILLAGGVVLILTLSYYAFVYSRRKYLSYKVEEEPAPAVKITTVSSSKRVAPKTE